MALTEAYWGRNLLPHAHYKKARAVNDRVVGLFVFLHPVGLSYNFTIYNL